MKDLKQRYIDFISEYDPYNQDETPEEPSEMLYNLLAIREDFNADPDSDPALLEALNATIEQFKAEGVEII